MKSDIDIDFSIGLDAGPVHFGLIGEEKFEYTVIGNAVNRASKIEKLNRKNMTNICCSEDFYNNLSNEDKNKFKIDEEVIYVPK